MRSTSEHIADRPTGPIGITHVDPPDDRPELDRRGLLRTLDVLVVLLLLVLSGILLALPPRSRTRGGGIPAEIATMKQGFEAYKLKFNEYPPNFADPKRVRAHMRYCFPRWDEANDPVPQGLDEAEALVFWLRGFKNDPRHPIGGASMTNRNGFFAFNQGPLRDDDGDGYPEYYRRNLKAPYVYFSAQHYDQTSFCSPAHPEWGTAVPYRMVAESWTEPYSFQIISAGFDNHFGKTPHRVFPTGEGYTSEDFDNFGNFSLGQPLSGFLPLSRLSIREN